MAEISDAGRPGIRTGTFARITGRVQGVAFRASAKEEADELGLIGWVRNTDDGAVELLVGGEGPAVDALLRWAEEGPGAAEVGSVQAREAAEEELQTLPGTGFEIRR
ncbi:acylphosphatase [Nesterenkonia lacusekhoensis]|uniref:Acylphosphatase n=1 Tax=Nesterenkonia lacusekhoensis TaxID=150832 RepID=A0ABS4T2E6_9MICC|nr:acylphosphatase [Nesterenkonia lacusekhoensis]MBP2318614.1 acylphosphatase [Nesterenkonia lacusekhoensis]